MKIIFIGTPEFGAIILEELVKADFKPVLVITASDKPVGRKQILTPPPVKVLAKKYNISVLQPEKVSSCKFQASSTNPDLIIVAAYSQIIPKEVLDIPKYGCLNVHPSLLPSWRGASPIQSSILNGDAKTGVSIILMDEKMDHGPIVAQRQLEFFPPEAGSRRDGTIFNFQFSKLSQELADLGARLLIEILPKWLRGEIKPVSQDDSQATFTKIIKKEDGKTDWQKPAEEIERRVRALTPWPGVFTNFDGKTLKILEAKIDISETEKQIGEVFLNNNGKLTVKTGQNCLILLKIQLEGKKPMSSEEFLRGHRNFIGTILK